MVIADDVRAAVILSTGERFNLSGRVAKMVALLCANRAKVEEIAVGIVEFHFAHHKVDWRRTEAMGPFRQAGEKLGQ